MFDTKKTLMGAAIAGMLALAPMAGVAQEDQLREALEAEMIEIGMDSTEIEKLEGADLPTLQEIEAILAGEGSEQTKADQVSAALGGM
jgi:hypothetical protein